MAKTDYKYLEVYSQIKNDLISGKYPAGSMLPTEDELINIYSASKTTIRHAAKILSDERYIEKKQGRGTEVLQFQKYKSRQKYGKRDDIKVRYCTGGPGVTTNVGGYIEKIDANAEIAKKMDISEGNQVYKLTWLQLVDGRVFGLSTNYFRAEFVPGLGNLRYRPSGDIYAYFENEFQLHLDHIEDTIDVTAVGEQDAVQLGVYPGTPVMLIRRTGYCEKGIFQYSESLLRTDIFQMSINLDADYFKTEH